MGHVRAHRRSPCGDDVSLVEAGYDPPVRLASFLAALSLVAAGGCFEDPPPSVEDGGQSTSETEATTTVPCDQGTVTCACFPNGTCAVGLVCIQGLCEPFEPTTSSTTGSSTGQDESTTTEADSGSTGEPETTGSSSTGGPMGHILFTTADEFSGIDLDGLSGADAICDKLGQAVGDGPWVAVLSDANVSLDARVSITGEVRNVQGDLLAVDEAEFLSGTLQGIPGFDENGEAIPNQNLAWTGSMTNDCMGWSNDDIDVFGTMGLPSTNDLWLDTRTPLPCSTFVHLYCLSQISAP